MSLIHDTVRIGPAVGLPMPSYALPDQHNTSRSLPSLAGTRGLLLLFARDIWNAATIKKMLFMQKYTDRFNSYGVNMAAVVHQDQHSIDLFAASSPLTVRLPILADDCGVFHRQLQLNASALLLINHEGVVRHKWLLPEVRVWPHVREVTEVVRTVL